MVLGIRTLTNDYGVGNTIQPTALRVHWKLLGVIVPLTLQLPGAECLEVLWGRWEMPHPTPGINHLEWLKGIERWLDPGYLNPVPLRSLCPIPQKGSRKQNHPKADLFASWESVPKTQWGTPVLVHWTGPSMWSRAGRKERDWPVREKSWWVF